jgi:hypothetical protein
MGLTDWHTPRATPGFPTFIQVPDHSGMTVKQLAGVAANADGLRHDPEGSDGSA